MDRTHHIAAFRAQALAWRERLMTLPLEDVEIWEELGSTNTRALQLAGQAEVAVPQLVWALHQTAGRGRGRHHWETTPGALTFSLLASLSPGDGTTAGLPERGWIGLLAGVAVCDAVHALLAAKGQMTPQCRLKWPNDVYLAGRKLAGVLVESPASSPDHLVIGIGINVGNSQSPVHEDREIGRVALCDAVPDVAWSPIEVLWTVASCLFQRLDDYRAGKTPWEEWSTLCFLTGQEVEVTFPQTGRTSVTGTCRGITEDGCLRVVCSGEELSLRTGSVRRLSGR